MSRKRVLRYRGRFKEDGGWRGRNMREIWKEAVKILGTGPVEIQFKALGKGSNAQRGYMWAVVIPCIVEAAHQLGNDVNPANPDDCKMFYEEVKRRFFKHHPEMSNATQYVNYHGEVNMLQEDSIDKLDPGDRSVALNWIIDWATEMFNIKIPEPNEQTELMLDIAGKKREWKLRKRDYM